jgi:hypothetical protein
MSVQVDVSAAPLSPARHRDLEFGASADARVGEKEYASRLTELGKMYRGLLSYVDDPEHMPTANGITVWYEKILGHADRFGLQRELALLERSVFRRTFLKYT